MHARKVGEITQDAARVSMTSVLVKSTTFHTSLAWSNNLLANHLLPYLSYRFPLSWRSTLSSFSSLPACLLPAQSHLPSTWAINFPSIRATTSGSLATTSFTQAGVVIPFLYSLQSFCELTSINTHLRSPEPSRHTAHQYYKLTLQSFSQGRYLTHTRTYTHTRKGTTRRKSLRDSRPDGEVVARTTLTVDEEEVLGDHKDTVSFWECDQALRTTPTVEQEEHHSGKCKEKEFFDSRVNLNALLYQG